MQLGSAVANRRRRTVQSLERALDILEQVSAAERPVGITDLSRSLHLAKGSIARLVATLVDKKFLVRDPETAKYRLGTLLWKLGHKAVLGVGQDFRDIVRPVMERLHAATEETVHITVLTDEGEMVFLDKLDSPKAVRPNVQLGAHLPAYCVANGKAVLAFRPEAQVQRILRGPLRRYTGATIARKDLPKALETVRRFGYAVNHGEYRADLSGVAAPIRDHTGFAVAAIGISVPTSRFTPEMAAKLAQLLTAGARELSLILGYQGDVAPRAKIRARTTRRDVAAPAQGRVRARALEERRL